MMGARLQHHQLLERQQGQDAIRSALLKRRVLQPIHDARVSKLWAPDVSSSYRCRLLRCEGSTPLQRFIEGLDNLMQAGLGTIARAAVQPLVDLVSPGTDLEGPFKERADVDRVEGELLARFLELAEDGLTPAEARELLPMAESWLVECREWVLSLRQVAESNEVTA